MNCYKCENTLVSKIVCKECLIKGIFIKKSELNIVEKEKKHIKEQLKKEILEKDERSKRLFLIRKKKNLVLFLRKKVQELKSEISILQNQNLQIGIKNEKKIKILQICENKLQKISKISSDFLKKYRVKKEKFKNKKKPKRLLKFRKQICKTIFNYFPILNEIKGRSLRDSTIYKNRFYIFSKHLYLKFSNINNKSPIINENTDLTTLMNLNNDYKEDEDNPENLFSSLGYIIFLLKLLSYYLNIKLPHKMTYIGNFSIISNSNKRSENKHFPLYFKYKIVQSNSTPKKQIKKILSENSNILVNQITKNEKKLVLKDEKSYNLFQKGMKLLNENIVTFCNLNGINVSILNRNRFKYNLLSIYMLPTIEKMGPFVYYNQDTSMNNNLSKKEILINNDKYSQNFYIENGKYVHVINIDYKFNKKIKYNLLTDSILYNQQQNEEKESIFVFENFKKDWPKGYLKKNYIKNYLDTL